MAIFMQGLVLLISGVGIVYLFLGLLVWVMNLSAQIIPRFNHILPDEAPKKQSRGAGAAAASPHDDTMVAIAIAAVVARS